ncbi:MAG: 2-C-methyl-D-erythritol 2,4-cyclodiphosphate synthase [Bacteroidota bacterium]
MTRVGFGFDVHKIVPGRKLILGGVEIPHDKGLLGHSDADVLLHAICDALLGAAALGDIGKHFPDTDPRYKDISSLALLKHVHSLIENNGYSIENIDSTVVLESPKIAPYIETMRKRIAETLYILEEQISVKATTNEGMGFIGAREGAVAYAVTSINKRK